MNLIECKNLSFAYSENYILNDITFNVSSGDFLLLCGGIGCGKTTLLRLLKKEIAPKGTVTGTLDINIDSDKIGYIFQNPDNQIVCQTPYEEMAFGMANHRLPTITIKQNIAEWSAFFGLEDVLHQDIMTLSGGEKQMVNIAAIMAMNPEILILDEPSSMLDPVSVMNLASILKRLHDERGTTIILCEHNLEPFMQLANKVLYLDTPASYGDTDTVIPTLLQTKFSASMLPATVLAAKGLLGINKDFPLNIADYFKCRENLEATVPHHNSSAVTSSKDHGDLAISIKKASFKYQEQDAKLLRSVSLKISKGSCQIIAGNNGSGKTTLFKLILKALKTSSGQIKTTGKIAYLPQSPIALFAKDILIDDLKYYLKATGKDETLLESTVKLSPLFENICNLYNHNPLDLSGGQLSLASIFKTLLAEPDILLLDEPSKSLDTRSTIMLSELIKDLCAQGKTIVVITHNMEFASMCGDNICLLFDGEIIENTSAKEFIMDSTFYTTTSARITKAHLNALNRRDIMEHGNFDFM